MVKKTVKYKVKDKVLFNFLGERLQGSIEEIEREENDWGKEKVTYILFDGKHRYPLPVGNIEQKIK